MIDLELVKKQCRVDYDDDDSFLASLVEAAEAEVTALTGREVDELIEMGGGDYPKPIRQAILVRTAQLYDDAEGTDKPNNLYLSLIRPFQKL